MARLVHKTCNLCEATCGVLVEVEDDRVRSVRPDRDDPFSQGHMCPKAVALQQIQEDPDRLRRPMRRRGNDWEEISWAHALDETAGRLHDLRRRHGADSVASYLGNPGAHRFGVVLTLSLLYGALGSRSRFSASSLDQNPKHASSLLLYGHPLAIPVPDLDRSDFVLMLGANPVVSGGSLMTAPGFRRRIQALRDRGGCFVVVDPRRTETAELADEHWSIRPGDDAFLLAALLHTWIDEGLVADGPARRRATGEEALARAVEPFAPEAVAARLGHDAGRLRDLARRFAAAPRAVCYGRVGTTLSPTGTLNSWLVDVANLLTGNLDRPGGALFPTPAVDLVSLMRWRGLPRGVCEGRTRVRRAPRFHGEQPTACLAEEIATPGPGQIRGLLSIAGNPVLSAPNGRALDRALAGLDFYAAVDLYVNETTRHADLILPPTWSLEDDNYEVLFHGFAVRNTAKYSPQVLEPAPGALHEWQILSGLALRLLERGAGNPLARGAARLVRATGLLPGPRRVLDWLLRLGPHGDHFVPWRRGLRLADLERQPQGVDLGPLEPRLDAILADPGRRIDLADPLVQQELDRLGGELARAPRAGLVLIGRRDLRTNNSWLHNAPVSVAGRPRCTLWMHPEDARKAGLSEGDRARVRSRVGQVEAPVELCDGLRPGVVSLPHGWGHGREGVRLRVASRHAGVSCNDLTDDQWIEPVVGNAVLNGVPVQVEPVDPADRADAPSLPALPDAETRSAPS